MKFCKLLFIIVISISLFGCAGSLKRQEYADQQIKDPYQKVNRQVYAVNNALDRTILKPVADLYDQTTPAFVKEGVSNFFGNLSEPTNFINSLLQLKFEKSLVALSRFTFNSTIGLGGIIDIMELGGEPEQEEDFGQTLATWGAKPGPYVMLPLFGPSSVRDSVGRLGDILMFSAADDILEVSTIGFNAAKAVDTRVDLLAVDDILDKQVDKYSFVRSAYEQARINDIFDGNPPEEKEDF